MSRHLLLALLACVATAGVIVACDLNPQPLPPESSFTTPSGEEDDAATPHVDAGDLGSVPVDSDASAVDGAASDSADGGDAGDGGDASDDAAEAGTTVD